MFHVPEKFRITNGPFRSAESDGNNGLFIFSVKSVQLRAIASDGMGWEHVSVSTSMRCPTWAEMCAVKDIFWDDEDCVIQFHPPKSDYVNCAPYCLHLWRPVAGSIPRPPSIMVGPKL